VPDTSLRNVVYRTDSTVPAEFGNCPLIPASARALWKYGRGLPIGCPFHPSSTIAPTERSKAARTLPPPPPPQCWICLNARDIANREEALARAEQLRPVLAELVGLSQGKMAAELNARGIPAPAGGPWHAVTVRRVLSRLG
jgi:hypothetical protein